MRYANCFFYGLDGEIRPKLTFFWTPPACPSWALAAIHPVWVMCWCHFGEACLQLQLMRLRPAACAEDGAPSCSAACISCFKVHCHVPPSTQPVVVVHNTSPRWINSPGGPFWPNLNIQPINKSIGVPHLSTRHVSRLFNLI